MPDFTYLGPGERFYDRRDAQARNVGTVRPGDRREFDAAPDQWWALTDGGGSVPDPAAVPAAPEGEVPDPGEDGTAHAGDEPADGQ